MNYRHAFHVGNHGDILKHLCLALALEHLGRKPAPYAVLDTHGGAGAYRLDGEEALRCPEWRDGIGRLWDWADAPAGLSPFLAAVRAANAGPDLDAYPGSPLIALHFMRAEDRLMACDLHPEEAARLRQALRHDPRCQVHHRDGFEAVGALLPPPERRGVVLIDPPYEDRGKDLDRSVAALRHALSRFGHGAYLWWRPIKDLAEIDRADARLREIGPLRTLRIDLAVAAPGPERGLTASSMLLINPPFTLEATLREILPALTQRLALGDGARWRCTETG